MENMVNNFWSNKKVVVLGHTGFKGSWLSCSLLLLGSSITGISLAPKRKKDIFNLINLGRLIKKNVFLDIRNKKKLSKELIKANPDIIFHLAAQPLVKKSYLKPEYTYDVNFNGTLNLLNICKKIRNLKSLIVVTTDKCYLNHNKKKSFKENDALGGFDPYSSSKACVEILTQGYYKSFYEGKVGVATARAGNIIGGGDWSEDRIIPDLINSYRNKRFLILRNPNYTRPWLYIMDIINGYLTLAEKLFKRKLDYSGSWNFGPGKKNNITVKALVQKSKKQLPKLLKVRLKKSNFKESKYLNLNILKSKKKLNWKNKYDIDESIEATVKWYIKYLKNPKLIKNYIFLEIKNFLKVRNISE